jgi:hypothetical protein
LFELATELLAALNKNVEGALVAVKIFPMAAGGNVEVLRVLFGSDVSVDFWGAGANGPNKFSPVCFVVVSSYFLENRFAKLFLFDI